MLDSIARNTGGKDEHNAIGAVVFRVGSGAAISCKASVLVTLAHSFLNAAIHVSGDAGNDS